VEANHIIELSMDDNHNKKLLDPDRLRYHI